MKFPNTRIAGIRVLTNGAAAGHFVRFVVSTPISVSMSSGSCPTFTAIAVDGDRHGLLPFVFFEGWRAISRELRYSPSLGFNSIGDVGVHRLFKQMNQQLPEFFDRV